MQSDLKSFEDQIKSQAQSQPSGLVNSVGNPIGIQSKPGQQPGTQIVKVKKNMILAFRGDYSGCGILRAVNWFTFLDSIFGKSNRLISIVSPYFLHQTDVLMRARTLHFQRQMTKVHYDFIKKYKELQPQLKYRMTWEIDDFIWGKNEQQGGSIEDGVPTYNFGSEGITDEQKEYSVKIMNLVDIVCVSTQFLKDYVIKNLGVQTRVEILPNALPQYLWDCPKKETITKKITKPVIVWSGAPTHWGNHENKLFGDMNNSWRSWIIKNVKANKIEYHQMGGLPFFFEELKDYKNFHWYGWVNTYLYPNLLKKIKPDFTLCVLVPNNFNRAKSIIKHQENCMIGSASIGTIFTKGHQGPYTICPIQIKDVVTETEIDDLIDKYTEPENYNEVIEKQYKQLDENPQWRLESKEFIEKLTSIV